MKQMMIILFCVYIYIYVLLSLQVKKCEDWLESAYKAVRARPSQNVKGGKIITNQLKMNNLQEILTNGENLGMKIIQIFSILYNLSLSLSLSKPI